MCICIYIYVCNTMYCNIYLDIYPCLLVDAVFYGMIRYDDMGISTLRITWIFIRGFSRWDILQGVTPQNDS